MCASSNLPIEAEFRPRIWYAVESRRHEKKQSTSNDASGESDLENAKARRLIDLKELDFALRVEKDRLAVEKKRLALEAETIQLEWERLSLQRKKLKFDQENARVTNLIELLKLKRRVWGQRDLLKSATRSIGLESTETFL